jgi:hypothetical protein
VPLSVLGRGGETLEGFLSGVTADVLDMTTFAAIHEGRAVLDQYEVRLPDLADGVRDTVAAALELLDGGAVSVAPFFETSLLEGWRGRLHRTVAAIGGVGRDRSAGVKIRCGGLDASAVPSPVAVAAALSACRQHGLPLKATQGLHHPIRHFDRGLETSTHGFLNLFVAGALAFHHDLTDELLLEVVTEESAAAFRFTDDGLAWRDLELDLTRISSARARAVTSFGSCSFSEPRDDLRGLGLLDPDPVPTDT